MMDGSTDHLVRRLVPLWVTLLLAVAPALLGQPIRPDIRINNSTGTNPPAASGAGGSAVALALGCATTGSSTTIDAPTHGMSGTIAVDGSAALWMDTASGYQWTRITGFPTADTITVSRAANIAVAVDCAAGGVLEGTLGSVSGSRDTLCADMEFGWTLTVENTGIEYSDSAACVLANSGGVLATDGRKVIRGILDGSGDPPIIRVTLNANYINMDGSRGSKIHDLEFIRDVAGTTGYAIRPSRQGSVVRGIRTSQDTGAWNPGAISGGSSNPVLLLENWIQDPSVIACYQINDRDVLIANFLDECGTTGGGQPAVLVGAGGGAVMFSIIDINGEDLGSTSSFGGNFVYNTIIDAGRELVGGGSFINSVYSGNASNNSSIVGDSCYEVLGAAETQSLGNNGEAHIFWGGNGVDVCDTARYTAPLDTSPFGAATDLNAGLAFDPSFTSLVTPYNVVPLNDDFKSDLVFPGAAFPLQTPALPVSTMTAGASQLPGAAAANAYAY